MSEPEPGQAKAKKAIPERSIETSLLLYRLLELPLGGIVTYPELEQLIGRRVRSPGRGYGHLDAARRIARKEHGVVTAAVPREGIKRLTDSGINDGLVAGLNAMHRTGKREIEKAKCANFEKLGPEERYQWNARVSIAAACTQMTRRREVKRLEASSPPTLIPLPKICNGVAVEEGHEGAD